MRMRRGLMRILLRMTSDMMVKKGMKNSVVVIL